MTKAIIALCLNVAAVFGQAVIPAPESPTVEEQLGLVIPMRDHVRLAADVFLPRESGRWPAILIRTPYNRKSFSSQSYRYFAERGYAVVIQDVRGKFASQGTFGGIQQEGPDASDTIDWIADQPWSNGRVGMAGASYLGVAQWWAAIEGNPHLVTITPVFSGDDEYCDRFYSPGGALKLGHRLLWLSENLTPPHLTRPSFGSYITRMPIRMLDRLATGTVVPMWQEDLDHPSYDAYWKALSIRERLNRVEIPVLSQGGWFDNYAPGDLDAFTRISQRKGSIETWIAPTGHNPGVKFSTLDFGPQAVLPFRPMLLSWFDAHLKRTNLGRSEGQSSLHIFVMGPNVWREEHEWPLARTRFTPLYLSSKGHANSAAGDGNLRWQPVRKQPPDQFTYDPKIPVPTVGGAICCNPKILPPGPLNQTPVENRKDVLIYTSPPLAEDLEVTGPVRAVLYVTTSVNDTDFTAKLVDVLPDGKPLLVTDGIQRLRYRLSLTAPVFLKREQTYQISVDAGVTSYVFAIGHRIRLEVSSSNFPRFDRNPNTMRAIADETKTIKAKQTVFHEKGYQSEIVLPVIPRSSEPHRPRRQDEQTAAMRPR